MPRRLPFLFAVLAAGLLAVWLLRLERVGRTDAAEVETPQPSAKEASVPAVLQPVTVDAGVPEPQREPVPIDQAEEGPTDDQDEAASVRAGPTSTLVVRAIDKLSRAPLSRVRVGIMLPPPASSASIHVDGAKGTLETSPLTDSAGQAEFELPAGVELQLSARGEAEDVGSARCEIRPLHPGERRELTLDIPTGDDLHFFVRVLARDDRTPVAGASVECLHGQTTYAQRGDEEMQKRTVETSLGKGVTDADGRFDLWLPSWKEPDIRVRAPGFGDVLFQAGEEHETPATAKVVLLSRSAALRARILEAGGAPVSGGAVRLWTEAYHLGESEHGSVYLPSLADPEWSASADPSGLCVLEGLAPDVPFHVEILRDGALAKKDLPSLSLRPGQQREIEWHIGAGCILVGSAVDQHGKAVRERAIWLQRADHEGPKVFQRFHSGEVVVEARTDRDGRFEFADVSPGRWWVGPAAERNEWDAPDPEAVAPMAEAVEVPEGSTRQEIRLRVHRGLYIRGRVLDPRGAPATDTYVWGSTEAGAWGLSARTGADGAFAMGPLAPGRYSLSAHGWTDADSEWIEANAGDEDAVLQLKAGGSLKGTIVDGATGGGCAGQITTSLCDPENGPWTPWMTTHVQEDGTFRFEGLPPGTYCLAARAGGPRAGVLRGVSVAAGSETAGVVVTLVPGAVLRFKYTGTEGYLSYRILSDGVVVAGDGVAAGGTSESAVPAGRLVVECVCTLADTEMDPALERKEIELAVGEERELVVGGKD